MGQIGGDMSGVTDHRQEAAQIPRATGWNRLQDRGATGCATPSLLAETRPSTRTSRLALAILLAAGVFSTSLPVGAANFNVGNESQLRNAINDAASGDTVTFTSNITLTGNLPTVRTNSTINGANFTLNGNGQYRGLFVDRATSRSMISRSPTPRRRAATAATQMAGAAAAAARDLAELCLLRLAPL